MTKLGCPAAKSFIFFTSSRFREYNQNILKLAGRFCNASTNSNFFTWNFAGEFSYVSKMAYPKSYRTNFIHLRNFTCTMSCIKTYFVHVYREISSELHIKPPHPGRLNLYSGSFFSRKAVSLNQLTSDNPWAFFMHLLQC